MNTATIFCCKQYRAWFDIGQCPSDATYAILGREPSAVSFACAAHVEELTGDGEEAVPLMSTHQED